MKKGLLVVVGMLFLLLPFVSAKGFTWSLNAANHQAAGITGTSGIMGDPWRHVPMNYYAALGKVKNVSSVWMHAHKYYYSCGTKFITYYQHGNGVIATGSAGCMPYASSQSGGSWSPQQLPAPLSSALVDTLSGVFCGFGPDADFDCDYFGVDGFEYDEVIDLKSLTGSVTLADSIKDLGEITSFVTIAGANKVSLSTSAQGILLWLGRPTDTGLKELRSGFETAHVWACIDTDRNGQCDVEQARTCFGQGGDWYKGVCCGADAGYQSCKYISSLNALCGRPTPSSWEWAAVENVCETHRLLECPGGTVFSDGAALYSCGSTISGIAGFGTLRNVTLDSRVHSFLCSNKDVLECAGITQGCSDSTKPLGTAVPVSVAGQPKTFYCATDGSWTTDLDTKDAQSCAAAGLRWTGTMCCGEADDANEYYNEPLVSIANYSAFIVTKNLANVQGNNILLTQGDGSVTLQGKIQAQVQHWSARKRGTNVYEPCVSLGTEVRVLAAGETWTITHPGTGAPQPVNSDCTERIINITLMPVYAAGGCWAKRAVLSGDFAVPDRVINYHGQFYGCRITDPNLLGLKDTHTNNLLVNNSILPCGYVLDNARPGAKPHAVCRPDGTWEFTSEPMGTVNKSIAWAGLVSLQGISVNGCCKLDQCWNGTRCQPLGAFYRISDVGFVCRLPPATGSPLVTAAAPAPGTPAVVQIGALSK